MSSAFPSSDRHGDSRDAQSKIFQRRAVLMVDQTPIPARTVDISSLGLSVIIDRPLPEGRRVTVDVGVILDNQPRQVSFRCRVRTNVLAGMHGFRIALEFIDLDDATTQLVKEIMDPR